MSTYLLRSLYVSLAILLGSTSAFSQKLSKWETALASRLKAHVEYLASDELQGRGSGTEGEQLSAAYIASEFKKLELEPKGEDGYFQHLDITTLRIAQPNTSLMLDKEVMDLFRDYYPLSPSTDHGSYTGKAINLNSGIEDESLNWNDYEHADVEGLAVLIKIETPEQDNPHSKFSGWTGLERRVELAKLKGAKAVVFYSNIEANQPDGELKKMAKDLGIPIILVKRDLSEQGTMDIDLQVDIMSLKTRASNVIGFIDHGAANTVVIGAHHDHLGHGEHGGSLAEKVGEIHNGADDNASGTAGVIELARIVKENPKKFSNNNYLFIAFTAEELGLLGSKHFVAAPTISFESVNYMINMDMIGKLDSVKKVLVINGIGTSPAWKTALDETKLDQKKISKISTTESGIGASDHTAFYLADKPAVHFFTGQHAYYHKPGDDIEIVNFGGMAFVLSYMCSFMKEMDELGKVEFTKTKDETQGRMRFKVTLGIMPDYIYDGEGLRVDGVREGKPGDLAGLQKGDIIINMNGTPIMNIQDYMKVLTELEAGAKAPVQIKRGEEFLTIEVQF